MDNNMDSIIDDPLVMRKRRGRKPLGLTPEQMREHRSRLSRQRREARYKEEKRAAVEWIVWLAADTNAQATKEAYEAHKDPDEAEDLLNAKMSQLIDALTDDYSLLIRRVEQTGQTLAGYNGKRLRRKRG